MMHQFIFFRASKASHGSNLAEFAYSVNPFFHNLEIRGTCRIIITATWHHISGDTLMYGQYFYFQV